MTRRALLFAATTLAVACSAVPLWAGEEHDNASSSTRPRLVRLEDAKKIASRSGPGVLTASSPLPAYDQARGTSHGLFIRPPQFSVSGGYRDAALGGGPELSFSLFQELSLARLGSARARSADSLLRAATTDWERARLDAGLRGALAWISLVESKDVLRSRQNARLLAERLATIAETKVRAGKGHPSEQALARSELGLADVSVLDAEGKVTEARSELRFALGFSAREPVDALGAIAEPSATPYNHDALAKFVTDGHPAVVASRARVEAFRAESRLTRATGASTISVGGSFTREGDGTRVFLGFVGIPIPFFSPVAFEVARQNALVYQAETLVGRVRSEVDRDLRLALHEQEHQREIYWALQKRVLTPLAETVRIATLSYEAGGQELSFVLLSRQRLLAAEEQLIAARAAVARADEKLLHAMGTLTKGM